MGEAAGDSEGEDGGGVVSGDEAEEAEEVGLVRVPQRGRRPEATPGPVRVPVRQRYRGQAVGRGEGWISRKPSATRDDV